jgi:very-short-patch-repair endonuclease
VLANLDAVWKRLVEDGKSARIFAAEEQAEQDWRTRESLSAGALGAAFEEEALDKRLVKLFRERATLEQLTGDSAFFLALGFLEWRDAPETKSNFAPLLLLHVDVIRSKSSEGGPRTYRVQMDTGEHWGNPCLREKLKAEHHLDLPAADEISSAEVYLKAVEAAVAKKPQWRVHRTAALGFFNFTRYRLWLDLDASQWPEGASPAENPLVRDLLEQEWNGDNQSLPDDREVAEHQIEKDLPIVRDADSTQYAALLGAVRGQSMVVIGPPGSGKSQTITNLIAVMIAEGKRVLFVAQKLAALEVVQRRLVEVGLSPFCLPLHSHQTKPTDVHRQLRLAGNAREAKRGSLADGNGISGMARSLNAVAEILRMQPPGLDSSVAELLQRGCVLRAQAKEAWGGKWDEKLLELEIPDGTLPNAWYDERTRCLREWARFRSEAQDHWKGWRPVKLTSPNAVSLEDQLRKLRTAVDVSRERVGLLPARLAQMPIRDLSATLSEVIRTKLPVSLAPGLLAYAWRCGDRDARQLHELERLLEDFRRQRDRALGKLREPENSPVELSKSVTAAAATVAEWVRPNTPLSAAEELLKELGAAIGKMDDLLADSTRFPEGVKLLCDKTAEGEPTWQSVESLAALRISREVEDRPVLHNELSRAVAQGRTNQQDVRDLLRKIERARETEATAEEQLPGIGFSTPDDRRRWFEANAKLMSEGIGTLPVQSAETMRLAAKRLESSTEDVISAHAQSESTVSRLLPEPTSSACRRLAERIAGWSNESLSPPDAVSDEFLRVLTTALANETLSLASLRSSARMLEGAQRLERQIRNVLAALPAGGGLVELPSGLTRIASNYGDAGGSKATTADLLRLCKTVDHLNRFIEQNALFLTSVAGALNQPAPETLADIRRLAALSTLLTKMPSLPGGGMLNQVSSQADVTRLQQAAADVEAMVAKRRTLSARYSSASLPPLDEIASLRVRLEAGQGKVFRWFSKDYRTARRSAAKLLVPPTPADRVLIAHLVEVESQLQSAERLAADSGLAQLTNSLFKGVETDWTETEPVLTWAQEFFKLLGNTSLQLGRLASIKAKAGTKLETPAKVVDQLAKALADLCERYHWTFVGDHASALGKIQESRCRLDALSQTLSQIRNEVGSLVGDMEKLNCPSGLTVGELADAVMQRAELSQAMESLQPLQSLLATSILPTEPAQLRGVADWYERGRHAQFSPSDMMWIAENRRDAVRSLLRAGSLATEWVSASNQLSDVVPDGRWGNPAPLASIGERAARFLTELDNLMGDLPDVKTAALTFKGLSEILAQLQQSDHERDQAGVWDELLSERVFDTDLELLRQTMAWMKLASAGLPDNLLDWCLEAETDARLHWLKTMAGYALELRESTRRVTKAGIVKREELQPDRRLSSSRQGLSLRRATVSSSVEFLAGVVLDANTTIEGISQAGAALSHSCTLAHQLAAWEGDIGLKPTALTGTQVADHRRWAIASTHWGDELAPWILKENPTAQYQTVGTALSELESVISRWTGLLSWMRTFGELDSNGPAGISDDGMTIEDLLDAVARLETALPRLLPWADCLREHAGADRLGLSELMSIAAAAVPSPSYKELAIALQAAVAVRQATFAWSSEQRLTNFRGHAHDRLRREFAEADASLLERNRVRVADQVLGHAGSSSFGDRRIATPAMNNLLRHEEQKLKRHLSVRTLVERAGPALQELCPCWLMTPMAVAQFLSPGKIDFDVIIMDEASQLAPEDAWGAIARGRQLIVVGDPKQMPPTDFFSTSMGEDEDEKTEDEPPSGAKLDSILDTASNCLPHSWLQWHYRSRHQSLIAPANRFSYGDKLILFPSASDRNPMLGVRHTFVNNATTTVGRVVNTREAGAIVDRLIQIARQEFAKPPADRLSVGVVAMNASQMDCIQELLDARVAADSKVEQAVACLYENQNEPLIIRNLENIQGDERDVILISYTYGPNTVGGTPTQRFGPLNFDGGERRFNVLITRSKCRMEVFSSMRSEQIQVTGKKAGVQHFHYFLKFAESGTLMDPGGVTQRTPDSPFEEHVMAVLKADGYQVEPQVGVAGYFIDAAVRDPRDPERFILGIECDGATYHSSKAARDRDRLREQVLRDRGWRLYRVWSTDWFTNYEAAKESLLVAVARTCEGML